MSYKFIIIYLIQKIKNYLQNKINLILTIFSDNRPCEIQSISYSSIAFYLIVKIDKFSYFRIPVKYMPSFK